MSLGSRLAEQEAADAASSGVKPVRARGPIDQLRDRTRDALVRDLGKRLGDPDQTPAEFKSIVAGEIDRLILDANNLLTASEREQLAAVVVADVLGYGPIEPLLRDDAVSEIMVNGADTVYVERNGKVELTNIQFRTEDQLRQIIVRIAADMGRRIDESSPMVDARLADGSRVNAVIPPLAVDGPVLTIRKFAAESLLARDLVEKGSLTPAAMNLLALTVKGRLNIIVSGGTGTGKTTFLNILSSFIPPGDRIVTIEDAVELQLRQRHVIRLETRPANIEGRGAVTIRDLVRNSLRMRPDRIIIGECRGAEALDMLQAMNTGHEGSLGTLHANTPADALARLETMVLMTGVELPARAIREQLVSAIDLIVQLERLRTGARVVSSISEVVGLDDDRVVLNPLFVRHFDERQGASSELLGTGARPHFTQKLARHGVPSDRIVIPRQTPAPVARPGPPGRAVDGGPGAPRPASAAVSPTGGTAAAAAATPQGPSAPAPPTPATPTPATPATAVPTPATPEPGSGTTGPTGPRPGAADPTAPDTIASGRRLPTTDGARPEVGATSPDDGKEADTASTRHGGHGRHGRKGGDTAPQDEMERGVDSN